MPDYGAMYADRQIASIIKELKSTYRTAQRELKEKLADFNKRFEKKNAEKRKQIENGEITVQQYRDWLTGQVFMRNQWESNIRQVNAVLHDINNQSLNLINSKRLDVFAENYNFNAFRAERETGISFGLYNAQAVAQLVLDDPQLLPEWKIDEEKDYTWNYKKVNNIVKQGIIQGEGVQQITDRLCRDLCTMNENKMKMFARTALTEAQSAGRQQQMQDAHDMGIEVKKQWLATLDGRTRDSHRYLDGKEVPFDKPFKSEFGDIMFPGDPTADAADVFNCRCTIVTIYPKYDTGREDWRQNEIIEGQEYREWKKGKAKDSKTILANGVAEGKDITDTWERREERFDFEIEDVINAQGFDGMPRVVSPEEFDRIANDTEAICKRGYNVSYETSGKDAQAILDRYHEELLEGKWYVDCHVGGADYGQGMYSYVKYGNVEITSKMDEAVKFYAGDNGRTEVFTFDKDMKIVKSSEIEELKKIEELNIKKSADKTFNVLNAEEKDIAERMAGIKPSWGNEGSKAIERFGELSEERQQAIQNAATDYGRIVREKTEYYKKMDDGVYAALKGYDAIEADYDLGDNTHELVILNRTKLIFRGQ